jgi:hypothetical protein
MAGSGRSSPLHLPHPFSSIVMTTPRVGFSRQLWGLELLWKPNSFEKILYLASEDDPYLTLKIFFPNIALGSFLVPCIALLLYLASNTINYE